MRDAVGRSSPAAEASPSGERKAHEGKEVRDVKRGGNSSSRTGAAGGRRGGQEKRDQSVAASNL